MFFLGGVSVIIYKYGVLLILHIHVCIYICACIHNYMHISLKTTLLGHEELFFFVASNGLPCSWAWGHKHNEDMKKAVMGGFNAKNA